MRELIITIAVILAVVVVTILGCSKTTIIDMREEPKEDVYTSRTKADSTNIEDSSRTPISFDVTVEGWKDVEWK